MKPSVVEHQGFVVKRSANSIFNSLEPFTFNSVYPTSNTHMRLNNITLSTFDVSDSPKHPTLSPHTLTLCVRQVRVILPVSENKNNNSNSQHPKWLMHWRPSTAHKKFCFTFLDWEDYRRKMGCEHFILSFSVLNEMYCRCRWNVFLPYSGSRDDANEQNPAPAESMACWEHKDVLQEESV